jgi:zinc transporter
MLPANADGSGLICAYRLDARGGAVDVTSTGLLSTGDGIHWLHFDQRHQSTARWLRCDSGLDPVTADALLGGNTRPRALIRANATLLSLRGVSVDPDARAETLSIQLWSDGRRIITCRDHHSAAIAEIRRELERGRGPRNSGDFVAELADLLVERMDDVIGDIEAQTHRLGHAGGQADTGELVGELAQLRRRMMRLRRYLGPQRRALAILAAANVEWLESDDRDRLRAVAEQTAEYAEGLDAALAITAVTQDELLQRSSERTEKRIYTLTVLTAIFMPLSFLTGLLGVNLAGIPRADNPEAFLTLCAILLVVILVQLLILRLKGWL